jgi:small conductance mechanosensitive channel
MWGPLETLGLTEVLLDSMTFRVSAKTMPGKALGVEREIRWRIKRAFDERGIRIVGGLPQQAEESPADPTAGMAAPSAFASERSPQSIAASPITPPANLTK